MVNHPETPVYNAKGFGHRPLMFRQKHIFAKADPYNLQVAVRGKDSLYGPTGGATQARRQSLAEKLLFLNSNLNMSCFTMRCVGVDTSDTLW